MQGLHVTATDWGAGMGHHTFAKGMMLAKMAGSMAGAQLPSSHQTLKLDSTIDVSDAMHIWGCMYMHTHGPNRDPILYIDL